MEFSKLPRLVQEKVASSLDSKTRVRLGVCNHDCNELVGKVQPDRQLVILNEMIHLDNFEQCNSRANAASFLITCERVRRRFPLITVVLPIGSDVFEDAYDIINVCGGHYGTTRGFTLTKFSRYSLCIPLRNGSCLRVCTEAHLDAQPVAENQSIARFDPQDYVWGSRDEDFCFTPAKNRTVEDEDRLDLKFLLPWFWNGENAGGYGYQPSDNKVFLFDQRDNHKNHGDDWLGVSDAPYDYENLAPS
jgi:hypothetical protein